MTKKKSTAQVTDLPTIKFNPHISTWRDADKKADAELLADMKERGQLQPIIARKLTDGTIELIAGHRRFLALQALKTPFDKMDIQIRENVSDVDAILMAISENMQRKDLNQVELARSYKALSNLGLSTQEIADRVHIGESTVRERLSLLDLPPEIQEKFMTGKIPYSMTRALVKLNAYPKAQVEAAKTFAGEGGYYYGGKIDVKKAEEIVQETIKKIKDKRDFAKLNGPCPKCGSMQVEGSDYGYGEEKHKVHCTKCGHVYHNETKDPWKLFEIKQHAEKIGMKVEVKTDEGKIDLTPQEVTDIMETQEAKIETLEQPTIRSTLSIETLARALINTNGIMNFSIDGDNVNIKLERDLQLHFSAHPHDYKDGNLSKIVVQQGWQEHDKISTRRPVVEKWLDYVKTVPGNLKEMRVECVSCMAPIEFRLAIPHREPNSLETDLYCQKCAYERGLILQGNKGGENIG